MNWKTFYEKDNGKCIENYKANLEKLRELEFSKGAYGEFLTSAKMRMLELEEIRELRLSDYFDSATEEELENINTKLYGELLGEKYETSYGNPSFTKKIFGEVGPLLSAFYKSARNGIEDAYKNRIFNLDKNINTFLKITNLEEANFEKVEAILKEDALNEEYIKYFKQDIVLESMNGKYDFCKDIILNSDLSDRKYLYKFGVYVSENEKKTVEFLKTYPKENLEKLTQTAVKGFIRGFITENKNRGNRNVVRLAYSLGQEIIMKRLIEVFNEEGFEVAVLLPMDANANKQYDYDHRFDQGIYLNEEYANLSKKVTEKIFAENEEIMKWVCGIEAVRSFGEKPFSPITKEEAISLSKEQQAISSKLQNEINVVAMKYYPSEEVCFSIIAFPSPEIGEDFEAIFEDTLKVNMMDNDTYEKIQQYIIDALDSGEYVHVKGSNGNKTDIKVALPKLQNPEKETNFVNCVADVNIPLGEVFTSPKLMGTNGVLHLKETFLGLKYHNLELVFEDGMVKDYNCSNFDEEEKNKKYVKENLLKLRETLPLGEFAIGTNTTAYVMAEKYKIIEVLPILIIEKMGPHFAIGDTCFSFSEDLPVYNLLDKKEVVARENEFSRKRHENMNEAYTGVHTDITIPYDEIGFIKGVKENGEEIEIIRDGRFVLKGTEYLNEAFKE